MSVPGPARAAPRVGAREVLAVPEFRAMLGSSALSLAGDQIARLAVAVLVYARTGSALAVTATVACSYLTWLVGGPVLASLADRLPRRRLMVVCDLLRAALVALLVVPDAPLPVVFGVLLLVGVLSPPFDAAKSALLPEVLEGERYQVGNALQGTVFQAAQVAGFLLGGLVVAGLGARGALALDAASFVLSAALLVAFVSERPLPPRERSSLLGDTVAGVSLVFRTRALRRMLAFGLLGAVVMIAPEGLAVPLSDDLGGGPRAAGVLTAAVPAGFLLGSLLVMRLEDARRVPVMPGLLLVSGAALLLTPVVDSLAVVTALWVVCGAGSAMSLIANAAFMRAVPRELRGRAFGVAATSLMAVQGVVLLLLGAVAEQLDAAYVVALAGGAALLALAPLAVHPGAELPATPGGPA